MAEERIANVKSFRDLQIWQKSMELVEQVYVATRNLPKEELYGLTSQIRRSAVSIPSNIAEGAARFHNKEYTHFLYVALGSCAELTTQIIIASRLKYVDDDKADSLLQQIDEICKMTMGLIKKLKSSRSHQSQTTNP